MRLEVGIDILVVPLDTPDYWHSSNNSTHNLGSLFLLLVFLIKKLNEVYDEVYHELICYKLNLKCLVKIICWIYFFIDKRIKYFKLHSLNNMLCEKIKW